MQPAFVQVPPNTARAVLVLPLVDASHFELVLRGANGRGISRRTAADDDDVVLGSSWNP